MRLSDIEERFEGQRGIKDLARVCALALKAGTFRDALSLDDAANSSQRVRDILKGAVSASTLSSASEIVEPTQLIATFMLSLRSSSAFDAMLSDMTKLPLRIRASALSATASASQITEGSAKPIKRMTFANVLLEPTTVAAFVVLTNELIKGAGQGAVDLISRELKAAVAAATDSVFLTDISAAHASPSNGLDDYESMTDDIAVLLHGIDVGADSQLFLIVSPDNAIALTQRAFGAGVTTMTPLGGQFMGIRVLVSDGLPTGKVVLIDATGFAYGDAGIEISVGKSPSLQMDDAPTGSSATPTATNLVSVFQTNSLAIRAERGFAFSQVRDRSVHSLAGVSWGLSGSPA